MCERCAGGASGDKRLAQSSVQLRFSVLFVVP